MSGQLFIRLRGRIQGPFASDQLQVLARRGQFTRLHEISADGATWSRASNYPELFPAAGARPTSESPTTPAPEELPSEGPQLAGQLPQSQSTPPPTAVWHYMLHGAPNGPVDFKHLQLLVSVGQVTGEDLVWKEGLTEWVPASQVPGLIKPAAQVSGGPPGSTQIVLAGVTNADGNSYPRVSGMAVASLILGIVGPCWIGSVLAIIFGSVALHQIRLSRGSVRGTGLAIAGLSLGVIFLVFNFVYLIMVIQGAATLPAYNW